MHYIHPPDYKELTRYKKIEIAKSPTVATIPLSQHTGAPAEPIVKVGDLVKVGQRIGQPKGFISSAIHSSISGKVIAIEQRPHPTLGEAQTIVIESDEKDEDEIKQKLKDVNLLSQDEIRDLIRDSGIVGLGGAAFPTHVKLAPPANKKIDTFILNGAECEPYLTCDHALMLEKPREIILGLGIILKVLGIEKAFIGIEGNKEDAIEIMENAIATLEAEHPSSRFSLKIVKLKTRYPQGGEKQLIKTILNREVPSGGLPLDIGVVVHNVQTAYAIYQAVYLSKPLYERVITATGRYLKEPKNLLVRIGVPVTQLLEECGGFERKLGKVIFGGPMTGVSQYSLDVPVIKGTSGILFLAKEEIDKKEAISCIRCSRCINACPVNIMPNMIGLYSEKERFDLAAKYDPFDCIECGACSYVCPSKIPLLHLIRLAKFRVKAFK